MNITETNVGRFQIYKILKGTKIWINENELENYANDSQMYFEGFRIRF